MNADNIIYKQGTYPHSFILSLFTHCGLIGFSLFLLYFLLAIFEFYKELIKQNNDIIIYHKLFIFSLTIIVFLMANLSSFLVWYPAWFTFGFCFPILKIQSKH
jgi:O-antigen ligase